MENYSYIFVVIFSIVIIPIVLYIILKPMLKHNKRLNGIVNYDSFMRKYVFCIALNKEEFCSQLKIHNVGDVLEYTLSEDYTVITFELYNSKYPYKINVDAYDESIILRLEQLSISSRPAFHINEFFC